MTEVNTKEKILNVANELFAQNGFAATSMREIASKADVNLAAINYHFKNKDNLYREVFNHNYLYVDKGIEKIGNKTNSLEELTREVFKFFLKEKAALMNTFKIFLSDNIEPPKENFEFLQGNKFGPPGQNTFKEKIINEIKKEISEEDLEWAMKMIFSLLVHFGVIMNTNLMKEKRKKDKSLEPANIEEMLVRSSRAHLDFLIANSPEV